MLTDMPRLIFQHQIPELFGVPLSALKRLNIKPIAECSSRRAKRYDSKLIEKRLDELSGLSNNGDDEAKRIEQELIRRAQQR